MLHTVLVLVLPFICAALVALILLQHGKGADAGAAFGSGASSTVFGARGSANFLSRATAWLAAAFFLVTLALGYLVREHSVGHSVTDLLAPKPAAPTSSLPMGVTLPHASTSASAHPFQATPAPTGVPASAPPIAATPVAPTAPSAPAPAVSKKP